MQWGQRDNKSEERHSRPRPTLEFCTLRYLINVARRLFSAHLFIYNATLIKSHFYIATLKKNRNIRLLTLLLRV